MCTVWLKLWEASCVVGTSNSHQAEPERTVIFGGRRKVSGVMKCIQKYSCGEIFDGFLCLNMLKANCLIYIFIHNVLTLEFHPQRSMKIDQLLLFLLSHNCLPSWSLPGHWKCFMQSLGLNNNVLWKGGWLRWLKSILAKSFCCSWFHLHFVFLELVSVPGRDGIIDLNQIMKHDTLNS